MNRFQNGTWSFHKPASDVPKEWEVTYHSRTADRKARALFATQADAQRFADATAGKVRKIEHRGGFR